MKKALLTHILTPAIITILMLSCSGGNRYHALLDRADSLMAEHPDSAYALLASIDSADMSQQRKAVRMRYELQRAEAQNKLFIPFTTDSVLREVVRYYDSPWHKYIIHFSFFTFHSASNEALKSLYLLGCAYRDLHEAPIALLTWEEAIAAADTTAADCDFATLFRVYGQMAEIYNYRQLYSIEIKSLYSAIKYSLLNADTLYAIDNLRRIGSCYILLNRTDSAEFFLRKAQELYKKHGYIQEGLLASTPLISLYLEQGRLSEARLLMNRYEHESHDFDNDHELPPRKRQFYCYKGQYFEQIGQLDSAEYYFRKAVRPGMKHTSRDPIYAGLLRLFQKIGQSDSIAKYAQLYCAANDSSLVTTDRELTSQAAAHYDYTRAQLEATAQAERAGQFFVIMTILGAVLLIAAIITIFVIKRNRERKRLQDLEFARLTHDLKKTKEEYASQCQEINHLETAHKASMELLRHDIYRLSNNRDEDRAMLIAAQDKVKEISIAYEKSINKLREDIEEKKHKIEFLETFVEQRGMRVVEESFEDSILVRHITDHATKRKALSQGDRHKLIKAGYVYFPTLMADLNTAGLTKSATEVCLLLLICDRVEDIAALLNVSGSRITNLKGKISESLFGTKDSRSLVQKLTKHYGGQQRA